MIRVLFTGGGGAGNEALFRLLQGKYILYFGDADISAIDPAIPDEFRCQLPWASDPDYVKKMLCLCVEMSIDLLIPGVDEELPLLAVAAESFAPTRLLLPQATYVADMLDKMKMIKVLQDKDIPVPFTQLLSEHKSNFQYPCISKPRQGRGSRDVKVINSKEDAVALRNSAEVSGSANKIILQELMEGCEYTVQIVADAEGRLSAIVPVKVDCKRGITIRAETCADEKVIKACALIHAMVPAAGCYNIQLIRTDAGGVFPFEINPRVSTTLCLVVAAGVDPIAVYLGRTSTQKLLPFTKGVRLLRHWKNFISTENINVTKE
jgi:carbamoyl-phosphate synthase large subunit